MHTHTQTVLPVSYIIKKQIDFWHSLQHDVHSNVIDNFTYEITVSAAAWSVFPSNFYKMLTLIYIYNTR